MEASLTSDFAVTVTDTFTTLPPDPVVSKVSVSGIRQTTATADIHIANANGEVQTVRLQYRTTTPQGRLERHADDQQQHGQRKHRHLTGLTPGHGVRRAGVT